MQPWTIRLSHWLLALSAMMFLDISVAEAAQKTKKPPVQLQGSAIMGELDDDDIISLDEENNDEGAADAEGETPSPAEVTEAPKPKGNVLKKGARKEKKEKKKKRDKKREKLIEGFKKAEDFHKMWFHLPSTKIKTSLDKLTKFCKVACTASQCKDEEVANNCHLICPHGTIKKCPDPLKKPGASEPDEVEDADFEVPSVSSSLQPGVSPNVTDSIDQGESMLIEDEGEGG
jgi:hypothetical protein